MCRHAVWHRFRVRACVRVCNDLIYTLSILSVLDGANCVCWATSDRDHDRNGIDSECTAPARAKHGHGRACTLRLRVAALSWLFMHSSSRCKRSRRRRRRRRRLVATVKSITSRSTPKSSTAPRATTPPWRAVLFASYDHPADMTANMHLHKLAPGSMFTSI